jgi:hypothetical protein
MTPRPCGACRALVFECEHWSPTGRNAYTNLRKRALGRGNRKLLRIVPRETDLEPCPLSWQKEWIARWATRTVG